MKTCRACNVDLPLESFNRNKSKKDGRQDRCRPCDNRRAKVYYDNNKKKMIKQIKQAQASRSLDIKIKLCEYLERNPCVDCGESDIRVLEFDHQKDKRYNVAKILDGSVSIKTVFGEIEKCEVVCANCHKRRTDRQFDNYRLKYLENRLK